MNEENIIQKLQIMPFQHFSAINHENSHLEPNLEVESSAGMASGMQEAEGDTAINAAAKKNCHFEALIGQRARKVGLKIGIEPIAGRSADGSGADGDGGGGCDGWSTVWE